MHLQPRTLLIPVAVLFIFIIGCTSRVSPIVALTVVNESSGGGTSDGTPPPDIYIDVETQGQLGGIPYYVDSKCKVSVATFATQPGQPPKVDKRVAFAGTLPTTSDGFIGIDREFGDDIEFRATVAINSTVGLTSGFATGYIELNFPAVKKGEQHLNHAYLGATWDTFLNEFIIQGWNTNVPVGSPLAIPNTHEVDLRMQRSGGNIVMSARPSPAYPDIQGGWVEVVTITDPMIGTSCSLEFGAEGLEKGGKFFFDYFYVGGPTVGGTAETLPMNTLNSAIDKCDQAIALIDTVSPNLGAGSDAIAGAITNVTDAQLKIDQGTAEEAFQDGTRVDLARKAAERARKALVKAKAGCDSEQTKKKTTILKALRDARSNCVTAIANLAGVKATNDKKLPIH